MVFAGVVLVLVFAVVTAVSYAGHLQDVYEALDARMEMAKSRGGLMSGPGRVLENGVMVPAQSSENALGATGAADPGTGPNAEGSGGAAGEPGAGGADLGGPGAVQSNQGPTGNPRAGNGDQFVATSLYLLDEEWEPLVVYDEAFPIDTEVLSDALQKARDNEGNNVKSVVTGHLSNQNLYYRIEPYNNGFLAIFAPGYYIERNMYGTIVPLVASELVAFLAFFVISLVLARWAVRPVEEAWDKQQQFIADASHELKTPLTVIRANNSILLSMPDSTIEEQQQWIDSTETEAQIMQDLVNDMLYLAKADSSKVPLEYSTVNMSDIVNAQLLQFESVAFEKGVEIESQVAEALMVDGDASRLQRLVGTLMDNACKYVDDKGSIKVRLSKTGSSCHLAVNNTGPVIPAEDLPHLFDRFYRSDKARTRTGGYGLGLAIAKSIVDDHKGTLKVSSTEREGTTFSVEIPAVQ